MTPRSHWPIRWLAIALWLGSFLVMLAAALGWDHRRSQSWWLIFLALAPITAVLGAVVWRWGHRWGVAATMVLLVVLDLLVVVSSAANLNRDAARLNLFLLVPPALYAWAYLPRRPARAHTAVVVAAIVGVCALGSATVVDVLTRPLIPLVGVLTATQMVAGRQRAVEAALADVERLAITEPLTGALNRRGLAQGLAAGSWTRGALLVADLDHFKQVNDTYGHAVGDEVLVTAVQAMKEHVRADDLVARIGGEEFVVVLADPDDDLEAVADRLREEVSGVLAAWNCTVSIGATPVRPDDELGRTLDAALGRADRALYEAKSAGRNAVVVA